MAELGSEAVLERYRGWLYAAALYNLVWGAATVLFPQWLFDGLGIARPNYLALWQVVGMFVLVYAPAYWWAARKPARHRHIVLIGLVGKLLGPLGFVWSWAMGALPLQFGLTILTNDVLWWPSFFGYTIAAVGLSGGWRAFLSGE